MSTNTNLEAFHAALFEQGLQVRREVVGEEYVNNALKNGSSSFSRPQQELVTEWCWGNIWTRPGLERKQRSLLNLATLVALNRGPELAIHVRGAINNGLTEVEIREALLQTTIYCGVPAGVEAFKIAQKTIEIMKEAGEYKPPA
ncbi:CMD-domain-containing protein [Aspergillus pseudoustus]|uniref:CMD-domain-containing protein n=1 Tax=Aspergillus pseudoustus TaxID=1810923 RepID=A0ABR4IFM3_9EURO